MSAPPLPVCRVAELDAPEADQRWLVEPLWSRAAVGFIAALPKLGKTWLGLDLALSVASDTPCLGRFEVDDPGPTLVFRCCLVRRFTDCGSCCLCIGMWPTFRVSASFGNAKDMWPNG